MESDARRRGGSLEAHPPLTVFNLLTAGAGVALLAESRARVARVAAISGGGGEEIRAEMTWLSRFEFR